MSHPNTCHYWGPQEKKSSTQNSPWFQLRQNLTQIQMELHFLLHVDTKQALFVPKNCRTFLATTQAGIYYR